MLIILLGVFSAISMAYTYRKMQTEHWAYALGLTSLPLIYIGFAIYAYYLGAGTKAIWQELIFGLPFLAIGLFSLVHKAKFQHSEWLLWLLIIGWGLHGVYDLYYERLIMNQGTPDWYPIFCAAIDLSTALILVVLLIIRQKFYKNSEMIN